MLFSKSPLKVFELELEKSLRLGWEKRVAEGGAGEVIAYGVISPEGMESVEPFVLTKDDAAVILKDWQAEKMDLRCALAFPPGRHQGASLEAVFAPVAEVYGKLELDEQVVMENGTWSLIEEVVIRVMRRMDRKKVFGDRAKQGGPFLGFFGYEMSSEQLAGHLAELNPKRWVEEWIAGPASVPSGQVVLHGKAKTDVTVDNVSLQNGAGLIATTGWDGSARVWRVGDMKEPLFAKTDWDHGITVHALSADGAWLFVAWRNQFTGCGLFRIDLRKKKRTAFGMPEKREMWAMACHPSEPWLAVGLDNGLVRIWAYERETVMREWTAHSACVRSLVFSREGAVLFSGTREDGVRAWGTCDGGQLFAAAGDGESLVLSPDGGELVVLSCGEVPSQTLRILDARTGVELRRIRLNLGEVGKEFAHMEHGARCAAISHNGAVLAVGVGFGEGAAHVRILDYATGEERERAVFGHECVTGIAFVPGSDRRVLFAGRHFRGAQLYEWMPSPLGQLRAKVSSG